MREQEGTAAIPAHSQETACCEHVSRMLARISDRWTMLVVRVLGRGPCRFNALRREVGEISQKMLASTLRDLEENGFVSRTVTPTTPPQVEYALTGLGRDLLTPGAGACRMGHRQFGAHGGGPAGFRKTPGASLKPDDLSATRHLSLTICFNS